MKYIIELRISHFSLKRNLIKRIDEFARKYSLILLQSFCLKRFVTYCQLISDEILKLDELSRKEEA